MSDVLRLWARVDIPAEAVDQLPYRALRGMPGGPQEQMPTPAVLVIEPDPSGFYLFGYAADGSFAGDTWHEDLETAQGQATFAYGRYLGRWQEIPSEVEDPAAYALDRRKGDERDERRPGDIPVR